MGPWAGHGVGRSAAVAAFDRFAGRWQVMQVPENKAAVRFWRRVIGSWTGGAFEERLLPEPDRGNALRNVMTFTSPASRPR
jgi:predicted acetyltransferase